MEFFAIMVFITIFLSCFFGAIFFLFRAIRLSFAKQYWLGFRSLLFSILLGFIVLCLVPSSGHHEGEGSRRVTCLNNLRQIALFIKIYANDHDGSYPPAFGGLISTNCVRMGDLIVFSCPSLRHSLPSKYKPSFLSTNVNEFNTYAYVSGLTEEAPPEAVLAFCLPENHRCEGANVVFNSGRVQWFSCKSGSDPKNGKPIPSIHDLTNTPSLFYGTTNEVQLAELKKRTRIIYPKKR